jgi:hypothetical protein
MPADRVVGKHEAIDAKAVMEPVDESPILRFSN